MDLSVAFGNRAVCERFARLWLQKFRSEDLSVCVETRSCRPHILDDESLKAAKKRTIDKPEETVLTEPCITVGSQEATTSDGLFLVSFSASQRTYIWSSAHKWRKVGIVWHSQECQTLVVTTEPCTLHHKNTSTTKQDHALYLVDSSTSDALWISTIGPNHHCRSILAEVRTCAIDSEAEGVG